VFAELGETDDHALLLGSAEDWLTAPQMHAIRLRADDRDHVLDPGEVAWSRLETAACRLQLARSAPPEYESVSRQSFAVSEGDGLEPRVRPDGLEQMADVVPDGLSAQVEFLRDLRRRAPALEQAKDFGLAWREVELRVRLRFLDQVGDLTEDAHDAIAAGERDGTDLDRHPLTLVADEHYRAVRRISAAKQLAREHLAGASVFLGSDDRRELTPFDVPDETTGGAVHPADHARRVDQVARDIDVLERVGHLGLHRRER